MTAHSTLVGGSSAARVIACPASVKLSEDIPPSPPSVYAQEGTALHHVMEMWFDGRELDDFLGTTIEGIEINPERMGLLVTAKDATVEMFKRYNIEDYEPEGTVHYSTIPGAFGTCDVFGQGDEFVVLGDFKFGSGVMVSAENNKQLLFYAGAAMQDAAYKDWFTGDPDQKVALCIIQPANEEGALQVWETTAGEVQRFVVELEAAIKLTEKDTSPCTGDHCRWCPAAPVCPAKNAQADQALSMSPKALEDVSSALELATQLESWVKQVKQLAHQQLERGDEVPGWKLVKKRATRKWLDEGETLAYLKRSRSFVADEYRTEKMITPPAMEKLCKAKGVDFEQFDAMIEMSSTGTTLAREDDKRAGVVRSGDREIPEALAQTMKQKATGDSSDE